MIIALRPTRSLAAKSYLDIRNNVASRRQNGKGLASYLFGAYGYKYPAINPLSFLRTSVCICGPKMGVQNSKQVADAVIAACQQQGTSGRIDCIISDEKVRPGWATPRCTH
jgi:hypothetical protein